MRYLRHLALAAVVAGAIPSGGGAPSQAQPLGGPPPSALDACRDRADGAACAFQTPRGAVRGHCRAPDGRLACVPNGGPSGGGRPGAGGGAGPAGKPGYTPNAPYADAVRLTNRLSDTGQVTCFTDSRPVDCAEAARRGWPGQDAHYAGPPQDFRDGGDGTVFDPATGLTWQKGHDEDRLGFRDSEAACGALTLGGRDDWRLPTIKELISISHWQGVTGHRFFVAPAFDLAPPDASILVGDPFAATHRVDMMGQTWSSTIYADDHYGRPGVRGAFFFNFLDGRVKQAPTQGGARLFRRCVAGQEWGRNAFRANGDGTVGDALTGLTWQQADDGTPRPWGEALRYCDALRLAGHDDWRLPNAKELQGIVDYGRPQPAIDPVFTMTDPAAWMWSSTTFGDDPREAVYVCFGKCTAADGTDVHGAGALRSDPKSDTSRIGQSRGGQGDEIRVLNGVRCVRG